jgi:hypothetical protein
MRLPVLRSNVGIAAPRAEHSVTSEILPFQANEISLKSNLLIRIFRRQYARLIARNSHRAPYSEVLAVAPRSIQKTALAHQGLLRARCDIP